jgi:hypothetical protein
LVPIRDITTLSHVGARVTLEFMTELPPSQAVAPAGAGVGADPYDDDAEDWFGDGSSFDTGEDLAAALFAMAGAPVPDLEEPPQIEEVGRPFAPSILSVNTSSFKVVEPGSRPAPWSVRGPGTPMPREGTDHWGIRHGVQILKRTEQMMSRLQRDAVEVTFAAAGAACSQATPERRIRLLPGRK